MFSIVAVLVCIPTKSVREFPFLHTFSSIYWDFPSHENSKLQNCHEEKKVKQKSKEPDDIKYKPKYEIPKNSLSSLSHTRDVLETWIGKWKWSRSVMSDSQQPHGLQPTRLPCPWDFPGESTGVGCKTTFILRRNISENWTFKTSL